MPKEPYIINTPDGDAFDVPVEGSLGLLALGDLGLMAWRAKIENTKRKMAARSLGVDQKPAPTGTSRKERADG